MTALTWPMDWDAEVHDVTTRGDDDDDRARVHAEAALAQLVELQAAQVQYKAAILRGRAKEPRLGGRTVLRTVMELVLLPSLARPRSERSERDTGVISLCLHLFRNLLMIRDAEVSTLASSTAVAHATLQSTLLQQLDETHVLDTLHMLASQSDTSEYSVWAPVVAECVYAMYVGSDPVALGEADASDADAGAASAAGEADASASAAPGAAAAPGTSALAASLAADAARRHDARPSSARHSRFNTTIQFQASDGTLRVARTPAALTASAAQLEQQVADKARRRIARKRRAVERGAARWTTWTPGARGVVRAWAARFLRDGVFGVLLPAYLKDIHAERERVGDIARARCQALELGTYFVTLARVMRVPLASVAAWLDVWAFRLARARAASALEARQWREFVASVRLWTALLELLDAARRGTEDERAAGAALQHKLFYDGDALETALHVMHAYSAQSFACLEAVLVFAHTMARALERYAAQHTHLFVQKKGTSDRAERQFRFESFQRAMMTSRLAHLCTQYLLRWRDARAPQRTLPQLAALVHRMDVKAHRGALLYGAATRAAWSRVLRADGDALARAEPKAAEALRELHRRLERGFARLDAAAQAAFNANKRLPKREHAELYVQSDLTQAEQIGVAVGLLAEMEQFGVLAWARDGLDAARRHKDAAAPGADEPRAVPLPPPGAAGQLAETRLLARLLGLEADAAADAGAATYYVPAAVTPSELAHAVHVMDTYMATPLVRDEPLRSLVHRLRPAKKARRDARSAAGDTRGTTPPRDDADARGPWSDGSASPEAPPSPDGLLASRPSSRRSPRPDDAGAPFSVRSPPASPPPRPDGDALAASAHSSDEDPLFL